MFPRFLLVSLGVGLSVCVLASCKKRVAPLEARPFAAQADTGAVASLFSNGESFSLENVKKGKTCGSVKSGEIVPVPLPWPAEVKAKLMQELARFELAPTLVPLIHGIYLADFPRDFAIGLTCHDAASNKMVVFLNPVVVNETRSPYPVPDAQGVFPPVWEDRGDPLIQTFFHELFHVLDLGVHFDSLRAYVEGQTQEKTFRVRMYELSWLSLDKSRFGPAPGEAPSVGLWQGAEGKSRPWPDAHVRRSHGPATFGLADVPTLQSLRDKAEWLQTRTNFFSPYADGNPLEDFAVTLETVYFGRKRNQWYRMRFFPPVAPFDFDTSTFAFSNVPHREKACLALQDVFGETCEARSP